MAIGALLADYVQYFDWPSKSLDAKTLDASRKRLMFNCFGEFCHADETVGDSRAQIAELVAIGRTASLFP
jgi:hypothetical protein